MYDYDVEARIAELGIDLTAPPIPPGVKIVRAVTVGDLVYLSGSGPLATSTRKAYTGKVKRLRDRLESICWWNSKPKSAI